MSEQKAAYQPVYEIMAMCGDYSPPTVVGKTYLVDGDGTLMADTSVGEHTCICRICGCTMERTTHS